MEKYKKLFKYIIFNICAAALLYLTGAFYTSTFNTNTWSPELKIFVIIAEFTSLLIISPITLLPPAKKIDE